MVLLLEINNHSAETGYCLSLPQLAEALGRSLSSVKRSYNRLKKAGYILEAKSETYKFHNGVKGTIRWVNYELIDAETKFEKVSPKSPDMATQTEALKMKMVLDTSLYLKRKMRSKYPTIAQIKMDGHLFYEGELSDYKDSLLDFFPSLRDSEAYHLAAELILANYPFVGEDENKFRDEKYKPLINRFDETTAKAYHEAQVQKWMKSSDDLEAV